jgi:hypothetical protein
MFMKPRSLSARWLTAASLVAVAAVYLSAQTPAGPPPVPAAGPAGPGAPGGPGGGGRGGGGRGGGGPVKLLEQFDVDKNGRLNTEERKAAYEFRTATPGRGGGRGAALPPAQPGERLTPAGVKVVAATAPLYDPFTLHTLFIEFRDAEWEKMMVAFNNTDVDIPANVRMDGKEYEDVGVHFRGASSFNMGVSDGYKRSMNLSIDWVKDNQDIKSYGTLNLLNAHVDPTFLRTVLYQHIMRAYIPAPKANYARVVINGESWGIYISAQQFNKDFAKEHYGNADGARWHVPGSPGGTAGLRYLGDDPAAYKTLYAIKSADDPKSWAALVNLTKVLDQTPPDRLVAALTPILDIDGALKLLAIENALINNDGIWTRASDYNIYLDEKGKFHLIPHDANETFLRPTGGRGVGPITGVELPPFAGESDPNKAIVGKLLAVPALRARHLAYMRDVANTWLDWNRLGPIAARYQALIAADVEKDTRKLYSTEAFKNGVTQDVATTQGGAASVIALKSFADERRAFLLRVTVP